MIVYGGEKVFAGGADITVMAEAGYAEMALRSGRLQEAVGLVAAIPKPVVAAITGYALGGGLELALAADFRVAGERARLGQPEILLGVIPGAGGTQRLPRLVGPARAKDIVFSGRMLGAGRGAADRPGRPGGAGRRGLPGRRGPGEALRQRPGARAARRQAGHRRRPRRRPGHRAWRSSGCSSPRCSAPRTSGPACAASWRTAPARPPSPAAEATPRRPLRRLAPPCAPPRRAALRAVSSRRPSRRPCAPPLRAALRAPSQARHRHTSIACHCGPVQAALRPVHFMIAKTLIPRGVLNPSRSSKIVPKKHARRDREGFLV